MLAAGQVLPEWRVRAVNSAEHSENKIHDDAVAREYGFAGGLVPGVTIHACMVRPALDALGRDWLARGTFATRFLKPFYAGDEVIVRGSVVRADATGLELELQASNGEGTLCAVATAGLAAEPPSVPSIRDYPVAPLPARRPLVSHAVLEAIDILGTVEQGAREAAAEAPAFLSEIQDDHPLFRGEGAILHPGYLIRWANTILAANVQLAPWIHVSSEVQHFSAVSLGEGFAMRGRVVELFERKGHKFVTLDLLMVAAGRPALHCRHTAIYDVRKVAAL